MVVLFYAMGPKDNGGSVAAAEGTGGITVGGGRPAAVTDDALEGVLEAALVDDLEGLRAAHPAARPVGARLPAPADGDGGGGRQSDGGVKEGDRGGGVTPRRLPTAGPGGRHWRRGKMVL